jgi:hypothetical protein
MYILFSVRTLFVCLMLKLRRKRCLYFSNEPIYSELSVSTQNVHRVPIYFIIKIYSMHILTGTTKIVEFS